MDDLDSVKVRKCCRTCDRWNMDDRGVEYHYCELTGILTTPSDCCLSWTCAGGTPEDAEE